MKTVRWMTATALAALCSLSSGAHATEITLVKPTEKFAVYLDNVLQGAQHGPFGSGGTCPLQAKVRSPWPEASEITLMKHFYVPAGARNVKVRLALDNGAYVVVNGVDVGIGYNHHEGCPGKNDVIADGFDDFLWPPDHPNTLIVYGLNRGGEAFLGVKITAEVD